MPVWKLLLAVLHFAYVLRSYRELNCCCSFLVAGINLKKIPYKLIFQIKMTNTD